MRAKNGTQALTSITKGIPWSQGFSLFRDLCALPGRTSSEPFARLAPAMEPDEREEMNRLCRLIQEEKDPAKFAKLVDQLIALVGSPGTPTRIQQTPSVLATHYSPQVSKILQLYILGQSTDCTKSDCVRYRADGSYFFVL